MTYILRVRLGRQHGTHYGTRAHKITMDELEEQANAKL